MKWDAESYATTFRFVSAHGSSAFESLAPRPGERITDLGCGTGELTARIAAAGADVHGLDSSPEMIEHARAQYPDLTFEVADGHDFTVAEPCDAVFSNAALHWMTRDPAAVLARVRTALRPGGRFVAEFGGAGNVADVIAAVAAAVRGRGLTPAAPPWYFPGPAEYTALLEQAGFVVRHLDYFERPTPLDACPDGAADWVRMFGDGLLAGVPDADRDDVLKQVNEEAAPSMLHDGRWVTKYVRLRISAVRPG